MPLAPLGVDVFGDQHRLARVGRRPLDAQRDGAADHHLRQLGGRRLHCVARADGAAAVDDRDAVADGGHLAQLVGDEDDRIAALAQAVEHAVELFHLLRRQQRGRLVQDERLAALVEGAQDLHPLLHPDRQRADDGVGIDLQPVLVAQLLDPFAGLLAVEDDAGALRAENDVLRDGEAGNEHEVLVDHGQPGEHGIARVVEADRLAVDADLPLVRVVQPKEDVHQGRFAGAVLAEQGVDLALAHGELDPIVGDDAGEPLDDPPHLDRGRRCPASVIRHGWAPRGRDASREDRFPS